MKAYQRVQDDIVITGEASTRHTTGHEAEDDQDQGKDSVDKDDCGEKTGRTAQTQVYDLRLIHVFEQGWYAPKKCYD